MTAAALDTQDWMACSQCRHMVYRRRFERDLGVCHACGWHARVSAPERVAQLFDPGSLTELDVAPPPEDPLGFHDTVPYTQRLASVRSVTGMAEGVLCGFGAVQGQAAALVAMDFRYLGGSLGTGMGELITRAAEEALQRRVPLVFVTASGGARMQEGALSLMQMAKTSQALAALDEAGVLTVSVITDPTYGGVAASFATLTDVVIAEPGARLGFAGPRVIAQTIGQALPPGFQTAEFLLEHGLLDGVHPRATLRPVLANLLALQSPSPRMLRVECDPTVRDPDLLCSRDPWETVTLARHRDRPTTLDYIGSLFEGFHELHGDRAHADCPAVIGGVGTLDDLPVMVIGHQKGHTTAELAARNFGMPSPAGHRKAARLMRMAAKLGLPVVTLIDTPGAHPGMDAERGGQALAVAENLRLMSTLPVPVVAVVTGEGGSGGALALAVANRVLMCENSIYSVISPEGCAAILWRDAGAVREAASALGLDARSLLRHRLVDGVVPEPDGGAHTDPVTAGMLLRDALAATLNELLLMPPGRLVADRRQRFRAFGAPQAAPVLEVRV